MKQFIADELALPADITLDALTRAPFSLVIANNTLEDCPIVYVNQAFEAVTGYSRSTVIGRNCRFLQGKDTDRETVDRIRDGIATGENVSEDILNYRADGTPFWNRLLISPIGGSKDATYLMGIQIAAGGTAIGDSDRAQIIDKQLLEVQHRVKNHLAMVIGMIRLQAKSSSASSDFLSLARRIESLQLLYEELRGADGEGGRNSDIISLGAYISRIANAIAHLDGRAGVRVKVDTDASQVPFETATRVGLITSEIVTNALQHAFENRRAGLVSVELKELSSDVLRLRVSDDGIGLPEDVDWPAEGSLGSRIVQQLVGSLNAKLSVERGITGTSVTVDVPRSETVTD